MIVLVNFPTKEYYFDTIVKDLLLLNDIEFCGCKIQFDNTFILHDFCDLHTKTQDSKNLDDVINDVYSNYNDCEWEGLDDLRTNLIDNEDNADSIINEFCISIEEMMRGLQYPIKILLSRDSLVYETLSKIQEYFSNHNEKFEILNFTLSPENMFKYWYHEPYSDKLEQPQETHIFSIFNNIISFLESWKSFANAGYELIRLDKDETFTFNGRTFKIPKFYPDVQLSYFEVKNIRQIFKDYYELFGYSIGKSS